MKVLVALCLGLSTVLAQVPQPCLSPPELEGRLIRVDGQKNYQEYAKFSYDENNKRVRIIEEVQINSTRDYYDTLALFNSNKEYKINLKTKQCVVSTLTRPFIPAGVPREAHFDFDAEIGAAGKPNEHLTIQTFSGNFTAGGLEGDSFYGLTTFPGCVPIRLAIFGKNIGFLQTDYFDLNIGIRDPNIWIPPSFCPP